MLKMCASQRNAVMGSVKRRLSPGASMIAEGVQQRKRKGEKYGSEGG